MKNVFLSALLCAALMLQGCGGQAASQNSEGSQSSVAEAVSIDYGDAESVEAALSKGENLDGKIVQVEITELHPDSALGYNVSAGEHLNFVSADNPNVKEKETFVVKIESVKNLLGSWIIAYEKIENAVISDTTVFYDASSEESQDETNESEFDTESETENSEQEISTEEEEKDTETEKKSITDCFEVVDRAQYQNSIGDTILIEKVLAKEDVTVDYTMVVKDADGNVIDKSEDTVNLVKDEYNYFRFSFDNEISDDTQIETKVKQGSDWSVGQKDAVEMVEYNQVDYHLYITFRQTAEQIGSFSRFKLLFYKGDQIVHDEDGSFTVYAENLDGIGSEDVASLSIFDVDYDKIEYIFEP